MRMKNVVYITAVVAFMLGGCQQAGKQGASGHTDETESPVTKAANEEKVAEIEFEEDRFDFGKITEGEKVTHSFKFRNTSENSLVISNAVASCGCTVPEWTRKPIKPGGTGEISVVFNSKGRPGKQRKTVSVYANTDPSVTKLEVIGEVTSNQ